MDTGFQVGADHSFVQLVPINRKTDDTAVADPGRSPLHGLSPLAKPHFSYIRTTPRC